MRFGQLLRTVAVGGLAAGVLLGFAGTADAQKKMRWKMQSAFGSKLSIIGEVAARYEGLIEGISGETMKIQFFEPGSLVPTLEGFDAVKAGSIDAMWGTAGYHTGKIPALAWYTAVPFGPGPGEFLAWLKYGGGDDIYNEIYDKHGMKGLHCSLIAPESSGWFREPITSVNQFRGLKMRFFGLGALVMNKMGASTQLLAGADIYPALERGVIQATEFSMPSIDLDLGFYQIAKHNYFPGWHQQASVGELLIAGKNWKALDDQQKAILEAGCGDSITWSFTRSEGMQFKAMIELQKKGVTLYRWPDSVLAALKTKWDEVVQEESAKDPLFKRIYENYSAFRKDYAIWKDHGYLR